MEPYLHFKFNPSEKEKEIDLIDLGESLVGFDKLIRYLVKITNIKGSVSIQAVRYRDGSIIVDTLVYIKDILDQLPFDNITDLLDFLKLANDMVWEMAKDFFSEIKPGYELLNDYFRSHPLDLGLIVIVINTLINKAQKCKEKKALGNGDIPERYALELHKLIHKHIFKLAIKPIIDDKLDSIEVSFERDFVKAAKIDQGNFENYLGKDDQILPHLENGLIYDFSGEITSLKSTRGDSLTFQHSFKKKEYNLDLLPPDGETTKGFTDYYKEKVIIKAEVIRTSFYKKPKLKLNTIDFQQMPLFDISQVKD